MSYEEFVSGMELELKSLVSDNLLVSVQKTLKNNGYLRCGIRLSEKNINISPTIYLEEFYEKYQYGTDMHTLAEQIMKIYQKVRIEHSWKEDWIYEFPGVKNKIVYRLINREKNKKLLSEVPYMPWKDLAIVFYLLLEMNEHQMQQAAMLIKKEQLEWWNTSTEDLYQNAMLNTEKLLPYELTNMYALLTEMLGVEEIEDHLTAEESMYVLTNQMRSFGAAAVLYPGRLEMLALYLKENFYILPSSVHEMIILPESGALPKEELDAVIQEINGSQVNAEEYLSDHAYYYDRVRKCVM